MVLTQLFHFLNFIFADYLAASVFDELSSLEVLTLDTVPANSVPFGYLCTIHSLYIIDSLPWKCVIQFDNAREGQKNGNTLRVLFLS